MILHKKRNRQLKRVEITGINPSTNGQLTFYKATERIQKERVVSLITDAINTGFPHTLD